MMKGKIGVLIACLLLGALALAIPAMSHAGVGGGSCGGVVQASPWPTQEPGSTVVSLAPADNSGRVWAGTGGAGAYGNHGYIKATSGAVEGKSTDVPLQGEVNPGGAEKVCVSAANQKVTVP